MAWAVACQFRCNRFVRVNGARLLLGCKPGPPTQRNPSRRELIMRRMLQFALLVLSCILAANLAQAQGLDGTLRVTVTDSTGASVESAKVTITNEGTNVSVSSTVSSAGTYVFPSLSIGSYTVSVERDGFKKSVQKGVRVESNQIAEAKSL